MTCGDGARPGREPRSSRFYLGWHAAGLLGVLVLPAELAHQGVLWELAGHHRELALAFGVGYGLAAAALLAWARLREPPRPATALVAGLGALLLVLAPVVLTHDAAYSRLLVLVGAFFLVVYLPLPYLHAGFDWLLPGAAGAVALGSFSLLFALQPAMGDVEPRARTRVDVMNSTHHMVSVTKYYDHLPPAERGAAGGGLDPIGETGRYLLVRGDGTLWRLDWQEDSLRAERLAPVVPINVSAFDAGASPTVNRDWFRVADVEVLERGDSASVLVSHHFWDEDARCTVVRLSRLDLSLDDLVSGEAGPASGWSTVYDTRPCLPLSADSKREPFAGLQIGGRLDALDGDRLIMTVGDHQLDGYNSERIVSQADSVDYGKTLLVHLDTGEAEIYSVGHRNPQGLVVAERGGGDPEIWVTEHGPDGGDELNRVVRGGNYGWPYHTYGSEYGALSWPLQGAVGLEGDVKPTFAWLPSIGISNLLSVRRSSAFPAWTGDLLVSTLKDQALWRLRVVDDHVVFFERIEIDARIRDVVEGPDGRIVLWADNDVLARLEPAEHLEGGAVAFQRYCSSCHPAGGAVGYTIGPPLRGVYRRDVASVEGYDYSEALERLGGMWTEERLDRFLAAPRELVPGTTMQVRGIEDEGQRAAIVRYLQSLD